MKRIQVSLYGLILIWLVGCGGSGSGNDSSTATLPSPTSSVKVIAAAAMVNSAGRFTLNNPWTQADLDGENITDPIVYQAIIDKNNKNRDRVFPYMMFLETYLIKRQKCEQDYNSFYGLSSYTSNSLGQTYFFTDRKCYPTLEVASNLAGDTSVDPEATQVLQRYGYYCGGGYPPQAPFGDSAPEPLDGVDYCCRLHDAGGWKVDGFDYSNECGILMCLKMASQSANSVWGQLSDMEVARQHWYGDGVFGGAAFLCPGNQSNDAPVPTLDP